MQETESNPVIKGIKNRNFRGKGLLQTNGFSLYEMLNYLTPYGDRFPHDRVIIVKGKM